MPDVNVKGRYRIYTHDGVESLLFTTYSNQLCSIRRPNPNTFITISTYIPGSLSPFTTFDPGSSYTIVTKSNTADFSMGPYTRMDRLPSSVTFRSPNFYHGLDKNSITVALSSYALSVNAPLSTAFTYIPNQDGYFINSISFNTQRLKEGLPSLLTHLTPGSSYQFINRTPFTFFAPLQNEMGDAYATGANINGEYGMGYRYENNSFPGDNIYGVWDKIVFNNNIQQVTWNGQSFNTMSIAALSSCGNTKALFVLGSNLYGQLGTGSSQQYYPTWTRVAGAWKDIEMGIRHMLATNDSGHLYACGSNQYGQLGLGSGVASANTLTLVDSNRNYVQLAASFASTMVRDSNGFLYACGSNAGQLGVGNKTTVYTLTQEALGLSWSSVKGHKSTAGFLAISNKKLYGTGISFPGAANFGYTSNNTMLFKQESRGWTDIITVDTGYEGTFIRRENQNNFYATGLVAASYNNLALIDPSGTSGRYMLQFRETTVPSNASSISLHIKPGTTPNGSLTQCDLLYTLNSKLYYKNPGNTFVQTDTNAFYIFAGTSYTPVFVLLDGNHFRPTPTPTPTITPTPSPVPSLPYNIQQLGIFGSSFQLNSSITSSQVVFNNTPGNLSNNFTLETINSNSVPPGNTYVTTFDFEKTSSFNNIVGIGVIMNYEQNPAGRENCRCLYRKSGSTWTYTILPSQFDALSRTNLSLGYRGGASGADNLFITPPNPNYNGTTQGIYFFMFVRDEIFHEAVSYDRGINWQISQFFGPLQTDMYFQYSDNGINKILYSRTRESNYKVQAVGYAPETYNPPIGGLPDRSLYFSQRFPNSTAIELISSVGSADGFDFKHDYFNTPTVVSYVEDRDTPGIPYNTVVNRLLIHRKIGNNWQTNIIKAGIIDACHGPDYQVPFGLGAYKRINSPTISIEFDSRNPDLIYVAYMLSMDNVALPGKGYDPTNINVLCYNMQTNSIVFEENVIKASSFLPGAYILTLTDGYVVDIPSLYFDTSDNTLNLFFIAPKGGIGDVTLRYYKTKRLGPNSWSPITNLSTGSVRSYITNSRELKTKY